MQYLTLVILEKNSFPSGALDVYRSMKVDRFITSHDEQHDFLFSFSIAAAPRVKTSIYDRMTKYN